MDAKAKKILFKTYWSSDGWLEDDERSISKEDFEYAKSKGLMFDPITITHDECISQIDKCMQQISMSLICKAFLSSLSTRRLDLRSSIASYFLAKKLPLHTYTPIQSGESYDRKGKVSQVYYTCQICRDAQYGIIGDQIYEDYDLSVLNFERIKWGGVRHGNIVYTLFDLKCFLQENISEPTEEDCQIFKNILSTIDSSEANDYPSTLEKRLKDVFKANKEERQIMIEILASIGVLEPKSYDRPIRGKSDWVYVEYWRGEDGYNKDIVNKYFEAYLN